MPARCSLSTSAHSRVSRLSPIWPDGSRSSEQPPAQGMTSSTVFAGPDDPVDSGCGNPGPFGHQSDQGLMLDRVHERRGGPGVADVPQPHRPVRPVQQVGVTLVRAQGLDEQPPAVRRDRRERP